MNSNELFRVYILNTLQMVNTGHISPVDASNLFKGYYEGLASMDGVNELTKLFYSLSFQAVRGSDKALKQLELSYTF